MEKNRPTFYLKNSVFLQPCCLIQATAVKINLCPIVNQIARPVQDSSNSCFTGGFKDIFRPWRQYCFGTYVTSYTVGSLPIERSYMKSQNMEWKEYSEWRLT